MISDVTLHYRLWWPITVLFIGRDWEVHMWLPGAGNDIAGTLCHDCRCLVVVNLMQEAFAWIDVAPSVAFK